VKPSVLPPTSANLIGTVIWAVLLSFSAVVNGVLSWQRGDTFVAWASAAQLLVTLALMALTVARRRKPRPHLSVVESS
jgi:membrane protein DedA with SNARE-associated domain